MIQRIQTLFLILFIGSIITTFFFPAWQKIEMDDNNEKVKIIVTGSISSTNFIENDNIIINFDSNSQQITLIGTYVVPEFYEIAPLVLATSFIGLIVLKKYKKLFV